MSPRSSSPDLSAADVAGACFTVRGTCMDGLSDGQRVNTTRSRCYWPGDVVVVQIGGENRFAIHRFLGYRPSRAGIACWTQADTSRVPDAAVKFERVVARADVRVPFAWRARAVARYVRAAAQTELQR